MRIKFTRLIPILLVSLVLISPVSCKKKDVKKIAVDNQFALSLFADSMSLMDVLGMMDSTTNEWLRVKADGSIWAYYDNFIQGVVNAEDLLGEGNIPDAEFSGVETSFHMDNITMGGVTMDTTIPVDKFAEFPVAFEGFEITEVILRSGMLSLDMEVKDANNNPIPFMKELRIFSESMIMQDGNPLLIVLDLSQTHASCNVSLEDCILIPDDEGNVSLSADVTLHMDAGSTFQGGDYNCKLGGSISNVAFKTVIGLISTPLDTVFESSLDINFGITGIQGDLYLPVPKVTFQYVNTFGLGTECQINRLRLINEHSGLEANLLGDGVDQVVVDVLPTEGQTFVDSIFGYNHQVDIMKNYTNFDFSGRIAMLFDESGHISVSDTSRIDITGSVEMPMALRISDLHYNDTVDLSLDASLPENEYFSELDFFLDFDSKIKLDLDMQVLFLNDNNVVVDSLFDADHTINYNEHNTIEVIVTDEKMDNVLSSKKMVLRLGLSTNDELVHFNVMDKLALRMRLLTKTSIIDLE